MNNVGTKRVKVRERSDDGVLQAVFHNWSRSGPVFYVCPKHAELNKVFGMFSTLCLS